MIKIVLIVIGTVFLLLVFFTIMGLRWSYNEEKRNFNNGICPQCGRRLKLFEVDPTDQARGYQCPNEKCDYTTWVSWKNIDENYGRDN